MAFDGFFQRDGFLFAFPAASVGLLSEVKVLKVFQVLEDGFAGLVRFGAPGALGQAFEALFDIRGQTDCEHRKPSCYTSIAYALPCDAESAPFGFAQDPE
ncbi:MAG TPA: hypothetical protein VNN17_10895 [Terriglobia bacterium]|nr:hypothetical protein [Terriglobia bacterium]